MKTVLFIVLPYKSHYYPAFALAEKYRKEGYRVVFTGTNHDEDIVLNEAYEFTTINYLSEYVLPSYKHFLGIFIKNLLDETTLRARIKEFFNVESTIRKTIETVRPEKIILETNISEYYLFFKDLGIETELASIYLSTEKKKNIPPLNSNFIPINTTISKIKVEWLWSVFFLKRFARDKLLKIAFLGKDDFFFQKRLCKKKGFDWNKIMSKNHFHSNVCRGIPNNILVNPKLEFDVYVPNKNEKFIDITRQRNECRFMTEKYTACKRELLNLKAEGIKIIYLAFGTLISSHDKSIFDFVGKVIEIVEKTGNYRLIYAFPNGSEFTKDKNNSFGFEFLPQLDVLKFADLMITHGGLGSLKECMDANIPMLVVPINTQLDQPGNAARVEANRFGKRVFLNTKVKEIENKLKELLDSKNKQIHENSYLYN